MSDPVLIVINDPDPVKEKHICWFSEIKDGEITLYEVVERWYKHPQAPDLGRINNIETVRRNSFRTHSFAAPHEQCTGPTDRRHEKHWKVGVESTDEAMKDDGQIIMTGKQDKEPMKRSLYDIFNNAPKCHIAAIAALLGVSEQDLIECLGAKNAATNRCLIDSSHGPLQDASLQTKTYGKDDLSCGPKLKKGHINQDNLHDEASKLESDQGFITIRTALQGLRVAVWESVIPNFRPDWSLQDWIDAWHKAHADHLLVQTIHAMLKRDWQKARLEGQCEAARIFDYKGECNPIEYLNLERQDALASKAAVNEFCVAFHKCGITVPDDELNSDAIAEFIESRFDECILEFEDSIAKSMSEVVSDFRIRKED